MRQGLIEVYVLTDEVVGVDDDVVDLVVEQVIEVGGVENVSAVEEILLDAGFEGAHALGLQSGIGIGKGRAGERFLQTRLFESSGVGKTQTRA